MGIINESLKFCVEKMRKIKFLNLELINEELITILHDIEGISFFEDDKKDQIVFALPLSPMSTEIICRSLGSSVTLSS